MYSGVNVVGCSCCYFKNEDLSSPVKILKKLRGTLVIVIKMGCIIIRNANTPCTGLALDSSDGSFYIRRLKVSYISACFAALARLNV